jgi:hypothetical protein
MLHVPASRGPASLERAREAGLEIAEPLETALATATRFPGPAANCSPTARRLRPGCSRPGGTTTIGPEPRRAVAGPSSRYLHAPVQHGEFEDLCTVLIKQRKAARAVGAPGDGQLRGHALDGVEQRPGPLAHDVRRVLGDDRQPQVGRGGLVPGRIHGPPVRARAPVVSGGPCDISGQALDVGEPLGGPGSGDGLDVAPVRLQRHLDDHKGTKLSTSPVQHQSEMAVPSVPQLRCQAGHAATRRGD